MIARRITFLDPELIQHYLTPPASAVMQLFLHVDFVLLCGEMQLCMLSQMLCHGLKRGLRQLAATLLAPALHHCKSRCSKRDTKHLVR